MPDGLATAPFDGEGVPGGKTIVFKNGVLKTFLYNTYTARKDNKYSTGNAARASYRSTPGVGLSNFYISPSKENNFDKLIKSTVIKTNGCYFILVCPEIYLFNTCPVDSCKTHGTWL